MDSLPWVALVLLPIVQDFRDIGGLNIADVAKVFGIFRCSGWSPAFLRNQVINLAWGTCPRERIRFKSRPSSITKIQLVLILSPPERSHWQA